MDSSPLKKTTLKYRPDIDGLRAVAVLSVIGFHTQLSKASGGFVGVDVFFVISGYLISSIVFSEIADSRFSIVGFYERRIRRIFPALFAMLVLFSIFAVVYFLPSELVAYGKSMLAATGSVSNLYFWRHSGYFDSPLSQPLLHTWSLAVEEQFYISFPLFLVAVRKFVPQRLRISVVLLFFLSLLTCAIVVKYSAQTAFYLPFTRAWELLLGTILSLEMLPQIRWTGLRNAATLAGIGMIGFSVLSYNEQTVFPGLSALVPCFGSALIIWAGEGGSSLVGAVLAWRPTVFIGLISYSLYLWHWPVIVARHMGILTGFGALVSRNGAALLSAHQSDVLFEVALSLVLATLSWRFIERPFRKGRLHLSGHPLFALAGATAVLLLAFSSWTVFAGGFEKRFPAQAVQVASGLDANEGSSAMRNGRCFITSEDSFREYNYDICLHQVAGKKNYLLLGDSHSAMLWSALASSLPGVNVMQASTAGCLPSLQPSGSSDCKKMMEYIFRSYLPIHPVDGLLIVGRWQERDLEGLAALVAWAKRLRVQVTIFGPLPEYDGPLPRLLAYSIAWNRPALASEHLVAGLGSLDVEMQNLAANTWHVRYVSLYQEICGTDGCAEFADTARKVPLMGDTNHLTPAGASVVVEHLVARGVLD